MTNGFSFDISFEKFNEKIKVNLSKGINVFYGESGSGKTELINTLLSKEKIKSNNYTVTNKNISEYIQLVFQNPENQVICPNLLSEVSFGLESQAQSDSLKSELSKIQSYLPFVDNWLRHPNTLSGGEMEILNIVTAFTSRSDTVFIDDGLSYLNASIKKKWVKWINQKYGNKKTILWFTSDYTDLNYGNSKWELTLSSLKKIDKPPSFSNYNHSHSKGSLSVKTKNLNFEFIDSKKTIIDNLNIELSKSRSLGIIGKNGCGKTTFVQLLTSAMKPSKGSIKVCISNSSPDVAVLNQFPERMLGPNTIEHLLQKLIDNDKFDPLLVKSFVNKLKSHQINWNTIKNKKAFDLSWSVVRIVLVVILSLSNFNLIILDEPTFGLGFQQKIKLSQILKSILVNKHLILVSHDIEFIQSHCDQFIDFDSKKILQNNKVLSDAE